VKSSCSSVQIPRRHEGSGRRKVRLRHRTASACRRTGRRAGPGGACRGRPRLPRSPAQPVRSALDSTSSTTRPGPSPASGSRVTSGRAYPPRRTVHRSGHTTTRRDHTYGDTARRSRRSLDSGSVVLILGGSLCFASRRAVDLDTARRLTQADPREPKNSDGDVENL
jgi:hypothetical protein